MYASLHKAQLSGGLMWGWREGQSQDRGTSGTVVLGALGSLGVATSASLAGLSTIGVASLCDSSILAVRTLFHLPHSFFFFFFS